jgi:glycosyltransferase involved in cell wall biosynthesis
MTASTPAPAADVGIPTFGEPTYLAEAIECVVAQTLPDWRLTISENGEGNEHIARTVEPYLSDPRISHVVVGENVGSAGNTTRLVTAGCARYVGILHDDDRWGPTFLERRVEFLDANPACGLVFSACDFIDQSGEVLYREEPDLRPGPQDRDAFLRELYGYNMICTPAVLVRRAGYAEVGSAYDASVLFHDYEMWLRLAASFDVGYLTECDAAYRVHATQTSEDVRRRWGQHRLAVLDAADKILPADFPPLARRRVRFLAHSRALADAVARRDVRSAVAHLGRSMLEHPFGPVDPATIGAAASWVSRRGLRRRVRGAVTRRPQQSGAARAGRAS